MFIRAHVLKDAGGAEVSERSAYAKWLAAGGGRECRGQRRRENACERNGSQRRGRAVGML